MAYLILSFFLTATLTVARMVVASNLTIFFMGLAQRMIFSLMALKHTFPSDTWMYDPVMLLCVWVRGLTTFAFIVGVLVMTNLGDEVQKNLHWLGGGRDNARERQQDRLRRRDIRFRDDVANGGILRRARNRGRNVRPNVPAANNPPQRANQPAPRQDSALTLYMKVVIMVAQEIMNNAVEGRWDEAQTTRLNWMWSNLVAPMFKEIAYSMAVQNICTYAYTASLQANRLVSRCLDTSIHTYTDACVHTCTHTHTHTCVNVCTQGHIPTHVHVRTYTDTRTPLPPHTHTLPQG